MHNSVIFSIFIKLRSHHHYLIAEHFHHPPKRNSAVLGPLAATPDSSFPRPLASMFSYLNDHPGVSDLLASLRHTGRRVVLGHTLNTPSHVSAHNVLRKFTILHWATFAAILGCMQSAGHKLDTPGSGFPGCLYYALYPFWWFGSPTKLIYKQNMRKLWP